MRDWKVYPPDDDTFLLLGAALALVSPGERVLEVGCGSGFISTGLLSRANVVGTDINPHALRQSREAGIEVVRADLLSGIRGPFDTVIFNPPYLPTRGGERTGDWLDYALDGGEDGLRVISRFIAQAGRVLAPGGRILLLVSSLVDVPKLKETIREHGFSCTVFSRYRMEGETLSVLVLSRGGGPGEGLP
ncbi:MAG: methyltransferase [Methanolinea sp.]|nr:methyltransferase [Methanolinea sp.]